MYYICKFSGTWSLYDGTNGANKVLQPQQIEMTKDQKVSVSMAAWGYKVYARLPSSTG